MASRRLAVALVASLLFNVCLRVSAVDIRVETAEENEEPLSDNNALQQYLSSVSVSVASAGTALDAQPQRIDLPRFVETTMRQKIAEAQQMVARGDDATTAFVRVREFIKQISERLEEEQQSANVESHQDMAVCNKQIQLQEHKTSKQSLLVDRFHKAVDDSTRAIKDIPAQIVETQKLLASAQRTLADQELRLEDVWKRRKAELDRYMGARNSTINALQAVARILYNIDHVPLAFNKSSKAAASKSKDAVRFRSIGEIQDQIENESDEQQNNEQDHDSEPAPVQAVFSSLSGVTDALGLPSLLEFGATQAPQAQQAPQNKSNSTVTPVRPGQSNATNATHTSNATSIVGTFDPNPRLPPAYIVSDTNREERPRSAIGKPLSVNKRQVALLRLATTRLTKFKRILEDHLQSLQDIDHSHFLSFVSIRDNVQKDVSLHAGVVKHHENVIARYERNLVRAKETVETSKKNLVVNTPLLDTMRKQLGALTQSCAKLRASIEKNDEDRTNAQNTLSALLQKLDGHLFGGNAEDELEDLDSIAPANSGDADKQKGEQKKDQGVPALAKVALNTGKTNYTTCKELHYRGFTVTGVYILSNPSLAEDDPKKTFRAYCDMDTAGGGWMLAFKQSNFSSGSMKHDDDLLGNVALLDTEFGTRRITKNSILGYVGSGKYKTVHELLFVAGSDPDSWIQTSSFENVYQFFDVMPAPRLCLYRPLHKESQQKSFYVSPAWNKKLPMWDDANIELMGDAHPAISAITIGRPVNIQSAPQCLEPHCSSHRHGRYNGKCQDSSVGEGNWMIFTR